MIIITLGSGCIRSLSIIPSIQQLLLQVRRIVGDRAIKFERHFCASTTILASNDWLFSVINASSSPTNIAKCNSVSMRSFANNVSTVELSLVNIRKTCNISIMMTGLYVFD
ncbi:hypothetical protein DERF_006185 [Dermatophagoides farinae]|uniref:Uncharacterized protein n=1 Tax=Dermatophagoides farinae TaxID=6954 RepID=A0A922I5N3_DERFA|nr:hypothetical protein DERF_006185 [Dermatophagoides farinae]